MNHAFILANLHENNSILLVILLEYFFVYFSFSFFFFFYKSQKTYLSPSIREVPIWGTQPSDGGWMVPHEWQRLRWEDWKTGRREWWYPGFRWRPGKWNVSKPWWWEDKSFIDYMSTGYVLRRKVGEGGSFIWKIAILTKRKVLVLKLLLILNR